jgi:PAS domain S-box-containing protein
MKETCVTLVFICNKKGDFPGIISPLLKTGFEVIELLAQSLNEPEVVETVKKAGALITDMTLLAINDQEESFNLLLSQAQVPLIFISDETCSEALYEKSYYYSPAAFIERTGSGSYVKAVVLNTLKGMGEKESMAYSAKAEAQDKNTIELSEQFRQVWEKSIDGMRLVDLEGKTILVNEAFCKLVGKNREELEGKDFSEIYNYSIKEIGDPEVRREVLRRFKDKVLAGEIEPYFERELYLWNGKKVWFQLSNSILKGADGGLQVLSIFRDISATKEYEEKLNLIAGQLKESNDSKDKFISILSHDLRGPFHGFLGITEILSNDVEGFSKEEIRESAEMLHRALKNQYLLLEDLLTWSRIQTKRINFKIEKINASEEIQSVIYLLTPNAEEKRLNILNRVESEVMVNCDRAMFKLLFRNLMGNAIKFSFRGGNILINQSANDSGSVFSVADSGTGIKEENMPLLFRMDSHFTMPGTENETGTGLGLLLCHEIADLHKGKIWAESREGEGSTFNVFFPAC